MTSTPFRKTILYTGGALRDGDVDGFVTDVAEYAPLGIAQVFVMPPGGQAADMWIEKTCGPIVGPLRNLG